MKVQCRKQVITSPEGNQAFTQGKHYTLHPFQDIEGAFFIYDDTGTAHTVADEGLEDEWLQTHFVIFDE